MRELTSPLDMHKANNKATALNYPDYTNSLASFFNGFCVLSHSCARSAGWWDNTRNFGELTALIHSEISEAMEGGRKDKADEHLPHRSSVAVELADAVIRISDLAGALGINLGDVIIEKMKYNAQREDHKRENREKEGGKQF